MSVFKRRRFPTEVILLCVRWYCKYGISYRDLAETMQNWPPVSITTDKLGAYSKAIRRLQRDGRLSEDVTHRTSNYLNNIIEADHGMLKQLIKLAGGFQTMKTASAYTTGGTVG